jgi:anti-sigma regulatory factor (Ser/Thr protein kinase)
LGLAVIPLQVQGQVTGCLWFVSTDPGHFSREVVSLLISLSIPLAVAVENFRHVEDKLQEEASRRQFYRDALHAVTRGKLYLCEPPELALVWSQAGLSAGERHISSYADVPGLRHFVEETLLAEGFSEEKCHDMALCATEAAGNVVKHAESGRLEIRILGEEACILIEDRGPGISFTNLPNAVLTAGFSTAPSLGMGYSILLEMADALYLCTHPAGTSVMMQVSRKVVDPLEAFAAFDLL